MDSSDKVLQLLTEIRDLNAEHLQTYKDAVRRNSEIAEESLRRQIGHVTFSKRVILALGIILAIFIMSVFLLSIDGIDFGLELLKPKSV
jgi:hypothetical protein